MTDQDQEEQQQQQQAQIVHDILAAKTLYDVLGVKPHNLDESTLRKAYLKTSVKVHPDKNTHPQATAAFQRVAEAWGTLSDASARAIYDAELRNPSSSASSSSYPSGGSTDKQYYAHDFERTHMPSFQEALFMFATVTSIFASATGGTAASASSRSGSAVNAASDFVETLFWAQKLAEGRQTQSTNDYYNNDNDNDNDNTTTSTSRGAAAEAAANDPLSSGMALGSGLRALANAQRALGMKRSAAATEKAATTVQVAAMGATVWKAAQDNPAVQRTLERGQTALQNNPQIGRGLRASLKMAGTILTTLAEVQKESQAQTSTSTTTSSSGDGRR